MGYPAPGMVSQLHSSIQVSVSNVGMISILRGSFDIIVPCVLDHAGRCKLPTQMSGEAVVIRGW